MTDRWLTVHEAGELLREAGYPDSDMTVRRDVDAGIYGTEGEDWYRTERGRYRMIRPAAVQKVIDRRRRPPV